MAQTSTAVNACDVDIWLDKVGGTETDISGSSNAISMNFDHDVKPFRTFGSVWPKRQECGKDASFTLTVVYSPTADEGLDILKDWFFAASPGARTLQVYIPTKNVGNDYYSAEVRIQSLSWSMSPDEAGPIMVQAVLVPDGEVTVSISGT